MCGHAGVSRAGAWRRTAKSGRWLRPVRVGIGAPNCAMRSAPSSNSCAEPSRSSARNSIRRTKRSEAAGRAIKTQARHSGSSPKPDPGAAVALGRPCDNVGCCRSQSTRPRSREIPPAESLRASSRLVSQGSLMPSGPPPSAPCPPPDPGAGSGASLALSPFGVGPSALDRPRPGAAFAFRSGQSDLGQPRRPLWLGRRARFRSGAASGDQSLHPNPHGPKCR
jgi:hypothetical protein